MVKNRLILPTGVKDYFGNELKIKEIMEHKITHCFENYGYEMVKTPTLEYIDIYKDREHEDIFKFIDRDEILALRYDLTPSICRFVSSQFKERKLPFRVSYIENTFRGLKKYKGIKREFTQAGVELIGSNSIEADGEIIALVINSILSIGIDIDFKLDISDINFLQGIVENNDFTLDEINEIEKALINGDFVRTNEIVEKSNCNGDIQNFFRELPFLKGKDVLKRGLEFSKNEKSLNAINRLINLEKILSFYNLNQYVNFDLSILGSFSYYSGLIFHGYCSGVGYSIVDGGRYDLLLNNFSKDLPAVGFAINTDGVLLAIRDSLMDIDESNKTIIVPFSKSKETAYKLMNHFRENNMSIILSIDEMTDDELVQFARENQAGGILKFIKEDEIEIINLNENSKQVVNINDLMEVE